MIERGVRGGVGSGEESGGEERVKWEVVGVVGESGTGTIGMGITGAWVGLEGRGEAGGGVGRGVGRVGGRGAGGRGTILGGRGFPATTSLMSSKDKVSCSSRASASLCNSACN